MASLGTENDCWNFIVLKNINKNSHFISILHINPLHQRGLDHLFPRSQLVFHAFYHQDRCCQDRQPDAKYSGELLITNDIFLMKSCFSGLIQTKPINIYLISVFALAFLWSKWFINSILYISTQIFCPLPSCSDGWMRKQGHGFGGILVVGHGAREKNWNWGWGDCEFFYMVPILHV